MENDSVVHSPYLPQAGKIQALVAARAGWLGKGLKVLLESMPQIDEVHLLDDAGKFLPEMQVQDPDLVLLDLGLFQGRGQQVLDEMNQVYPQVSRIVLVDTTGQEGTLRARGESGVILIGSAVQELAELVLVKINSKA